jgi:hypothetical protein
MAGPALAAEAVLGLALGWQVSLSVWRKAEKSPA